MPLYSNILLSMKESVGNEPDQSDGNRGVAKQDDQNNSTSARAAPNVLNNSMRLLQDHIRSKKRLMQQTMTTQLKSKASKITKEESPAQQRPNTDIVIEDYLHRPKVSGQDWDLEDEYNPMQPNNYELLYADSIKAQKSRIDQMRSSKNSEIPSKNLMDVVDKLDEVDDMATRVASTCDRSQSEQKQTQETVSQPNFSIGAKILSKMGYKAGQGLGKDQKGISSPLEVERCMGFNQGRILFPTVASKPMPAVEPLASSSVNPKTNIEKPIAQDVNNITKISPNAKPEIGDLLRESTRVLLLQNMVGPGEVDDDLEAETKEECKKYGDVIRCLIYEIPNKRVADDEAVRIFVEFKSVDSAIKAVSDLNGRFFGGRVVRASFFDVDRFHRYQLGPVSQESTS